MSEAAVPLLGDISLTAVQRVEHSLDSGYASTRIAGLAGELQQLSGRPSHRIRIGGLLHGSDAADQLKKLQEAAQKGEELNFSADITSALDLQKVVISGFRAAQVAGIPDQFRYDVALAESPPLPPPAEISGFGGLDDFGLGDLGFDTSIMGDLANAVGEVASAVDTAMKVAGALEALASVGDLGNLGDFMQPMGKAIDNAGSVAGDFGKAAQGLAGLFKG